MASLPAPPVMLLSPARSAALLAGACGMAAALIVLWAVGDARLAAGFFSAALVIAGGAVAVRRLFPPRKPVAAEPDWSVARAIADATDHALAVTDRAGRMVCANARYQALFGDFPTPPNLPVSEGDTSALLVAGRAAWRDGHGVVMRIGTPAGPVQADIIRAGQSEDMLLWRFTALGEGGGAGMLAPAIDGALGRRMAAAGVMLALLTPQGTIAAANRVFRLRATGQEEGAVLARDFAAFLITDSAGQVRFEREGLAGTPVRLVQLPVVDAPDAPLVIALLDEEVLSPPMLGADAAAHLQLIVSLMPFGVALVDRDGRFLEMNAAFARAAGVDGAAPPLYPSDLVVRDDKTTVADAVRRFAGGAQHSADIAVRLASAPDEPVALSITSARGLGEAAVLLSLKGNGEETRLKREVAQANKMQAVGQLAGGVAHDFNNILTAIIGHCDLMLMRHTPGDSDYDDIQQVRANSNRAASLTRQLLAFSRQQTLRPQVLQLPDVISEVSNLLKRLLGETVTLTVSHGRNLGPVRADPGQLEQVVMNLAVNARDAMLARDPHGGGTLTIQTMAVSAADVRAMGSDVLPVGEYSALRVSDTGGGIPPEVLPKIFEPFFTTKEIGKGTGLGLSTVYGIVKQSGGYIFAESPPGQGAVFSIYLPVHTSSAPAKPLLPAASSKQGELWGTGTILLVEDEDMVRTVAERALTRQGYTVLTAEHGEAALEMLDSQPRPDLLISDVVMPTMDGPTMVRHARARYPDLPILFMSGYAEEQLRKSIDLDNVAFLAKPFSVQQLAQAARDVLGAK